VQPIKSFGLALRLALIADEHGLGRNTAVRGVSMKRLTLILLLLSSAAWAKEKAAPADYQDAVLVSFRTVATGSSCSHSSTTSGNVDATTDDDGNTTGTIKATTEGSTDCSNTGWVYYTLSVGNHTYVVHHAVAFRFRSSNLHGQLPGAHLQVRMDGKAFYVRVNNKESKFVVVEAH
jgi:hypothetical protein